MKIINFDFLQIVFITSWKFSFIQMFDVAGMEYRFSLKGIFELK